MIWQRLTGSVTSAGNLVLTASPGDVVFHPSGSVRAFTDGGSDLGGGAGTLRFNNGWFATAVHVGPGGSFDTDAAGTLVLGGTNSSQINLTPTVAGNVNFGYASTALGGGAAATLGTIAGTGPATAAQNAWLKVLVNGVATWIPIWR